MTTLPSNIPSSQAGHDGLLIGSEGSRTPQMSTRTAGPRFADWRIKTRDCAILKRPQCLDFHPGQGAVDVAGEPQPQHPECRSSAPWQVGIVSAVQPFAVPTCIAHGLALIVKLVGTVRYVVGR